MPDGRLWLGGRRRVHLREQHIHLAGLQRRNASKTRFRGTWKLLGVELDGGVRVRRVEVQMVEAWGRKLGFLILGTRQHSLEKAAREQHQQLEGDQAYAAEASCSMGMRLEVPRFAARQNPDTSIPQKLPPVTEPAVLLSSALYRREQKQTGPSHAKTASSPRRLA